VCNDALPGTLKCPKRLSYYTSQYRQGSLFPADISFHIFQYLPPSRRSLLLAQTNPLIRVKCNLLQIKAFFKLIVIHLNDNNILLFTSYSCHGDSILSLWSWHGEFLWWYQHIGRKVLLSSGMLRSVYWPLKRDREVVPQRRQPSTKQCRVNTPQQRRYHTAAPTETTHRSGRNCCLGHQGRKYCKRL
jgi:hypothetical protein